MKVLLQVNEPLTAKHYSLIFVDGVDQDWTAQNVQSGIGSALSDKEIFFLTLSQTSPCFYVFVISLSKTIWEKEKQAISPFPAVFSTCFGELSVIFIKVEILSVWNSLKFVVWERIKKYALGSIIKL